MTATNDSDELEALFDSIAANNHPAEPAATAASASSNSQKNSASTVENWSNTQENVFNQLGQMTRSLHDTLGQLGYDKMLEKNMSAMPDTKARLAYVANLTEQAAGRVLNATDIANPLLEQVNNSAAALSKRWDDLFANRLDSNGLRQLALDTKKFLNEDLKTKNAMLHAQLMEIVMAQDFQDLTGQVIKKIIEVTQYLETSLMSVLLQVVPETKKTEEVSSMLQGPVINAQGRTDVVVNQEQVDELLDSLGF